MDEQNPKAAIDAVMAEHPPGSPGYRRADVQQQIAGLSARLVDAPPVSDEPGYEPLHPVQPAPPAEKEVVHKAAEVLQGMGDEGAALVEDWGGATNPNFAENFAYAKQAYEQILQTLTPDDIAQIEASGVGDNPNIIRFLASHGRLSAGLRGEKMTDSTERSAIPSARQQSLKDELAQLMEENPPGTEKYKQPRVQRRIQQLTSAIYGDGPAVGHGGRYA
jgi:hypothetical protein